MPLAEPLTFPMISTKDDSEMPATGIDFMPNI